MSKYTQFAENQHLPATPPRRISVAAHLEAFNTKIDVKLDLAAQHLQCMREPRERFIKENPTHKAVRYKKEDLHHLDQIEKQLSDVIGFMREHVNLLQQDMQIAKDIIRRQGEEENEILNKILDRKQKP